MTRKSKSVPPAPSGGGSFTYDKAGRLIAEEHTLGPLDPNHPAQLAKNAPPAPPPADVKDA